MFLVETNPVETIMTTFPTLEFALRYSQSCPLSNVLRVAQRHRPSSSPPGTGPSIRAVRRPLAMPGVLDRFAFQFVPSQLPALTTTFLNVRLTLKIKCFGSVCIPIRTFTVTSSDNDFFECSAHVEGHKGVKQVVSSRNWSEDIGLDTACRVFPKVKFYGKVETLSF
uniref:Uncharacterized protein n=1 Tax=Steinernema glaseri TaxID=37863 RepID=A0A1I7Y3U2_9BILA